MIVVFWIVQSIVVYQNLIIVAYPLLDLICQICLHHFLQFLIFAASGQPTVLNGQVYNNLPAGLAAQVAAVAAMASIPAQCQYQSRQATENTAPPPPVQLPAPAPPVPLYRYLPNELAAQMARVATMPIP